MKKFMPEVDAKQRIQLLKDNCDSQEETTYYKELSSDELDETYEKICDNLKDLSVYDDELTAAKNVYKVKSKPLIDENKVLLGEVKTHKRMITGMLYNIADHENGVMETYDENGEFVSSRRLRPNEKQQRLFPMNKAVNE